MIDPLERVSLARALIEQAHETDEIERLIADQEEQLRLYEREGVDINEIRRLGAEIRIRGRRRIGKLLGPKSKGGRPLKNCDSAVTVSAEKRKRNERDRKLAAVPVQIFEGKLDAVREAKEMPTETMFVIDGRNGKPKLDYLGLPVMKDFGSRSENLKHTLRRGLEVMMGVVMADGANEPHVIDVLSREEALDVVHTVDVVYEWLFKLREPLFHVAFPSEHEEEYEEAV